MRTRDQVISDLCYTWRHDFGLTKNADEVLSSGMTVEERTRLWLQMAQLYDNVIDPLINDREQVINYEI
jgi:hypothetical protein